MRGIWVSLSILSALALLLPCAAFATVTIVTVPVGNPGNAADSIDGNSFSAGVQNYGSVGYVYSISKYDVTIGQYAEFLNAVAATDTYALYSRSMLGANTGGIAQNGVSGSYTYSVTGGSGNRPINRVNWGDAARFANWLYNGQPTGVEGAGTTETGSYTLNGAMSDAALNAATRNANATWVIPTVNEWYKAAYYNPATSSYYLYPFSSDIAPTSAPPGSTPNTGNFKDATTGYAVTGSTTFDPNQNYVTDVGAYTASASPYGAFDMGGNVSQWTEALFSGSGGPYRGFRGGAWNVNSSFSLSSHQSATLSTVESEIQPSIRLVFVPEPSTAVLAGIAVAIIFAVKRKRLLAN